MSDATGIIERLAAAQRAGATARLAESDSDAIRFAIETKTGTNSAALLTQLRQALPGLTVAVARLFPDADDEQLIRFFRLEIVVVIWADTGANPFDLAYYLWDRLDLASCEPEVTSVFPDDPTLPMTREGLSVESAFTELFGCFKDEATRPDTVDKDKIWALRTICVPDAWALSEQQGRPDRGLDIIIGQPDTGVADHDELGEGALDFLRAFNVLTGDTNVRDPLVSRDRLDQPGHGTGTSSVVISRETPQIVGSAPKAVLVPIRCIESVIRINQVPVAKAIDYARRSGCHVITMSLGGVWSFSLRAALRRAVDDNLIVLAAAGNCVGIVVWPARFEDCIAVAGTNIDDEPWVGSCRGDNVDISAPAEFVWRAKRQQTDTTFDVIWPGQGTSFAVALTAGVAALWLAHWGRDNLIAGLTPGDKLQHLFRRLLMATARHVSQLDGKGMGAGVVNARALLEHDPFQPIPEPEAVPMAVAPTMADSIRRFLVDIAAAPAAETAAAAVDIDDAALERYGQEITWRALKRRTDDLRGGPVPEAATILGIERSTELEQFIDGRAPWLQHRI